MVHSIERSTAIKKSQRVLVEKSQWPRIHRREDGEAVSRWNDLSEIHTGYQGEGLKVRRHLEGDDLLNDFRDERYVGDWSIVDRVVRIESQIVEVLLTPLSFIAILVLQL